MTRGRRPKPTAIKKLQGNPGGRALNDAEPAFGGRTTVPKWLDKLAKQEWRRMAPRLERLDMLTPADRAAFARYCQAYSDVVKYEQVLRGLKSRFITTPSGSYKTHPAVAEARAAAAEMLKIAAEFGFTPAARSKVEVPQLPADDGFDMFGDASASDDTCHRDVAN